MNPFQDIKCFVFDMDGTINLGDSLIDGALELISHLQENGTKFYFFTNNSSKSPTAYVEKLTRLGFRGITREHIMTSGDVMLHYLKTHFTADSMVFLSGTPELTEQFKEAGINLVPTNAQWADVVVIGFDTSYDFAKADAACRFITAGAPFLATNIDRICPLEGGAFLPDCGAICAMLTHATGIEPKFVGKPFVETVEFILDTVGEAPEHVAMVGDRLYTDIATAKNGGLIGIAVLSGEISQADIDISDIVPNITVNSVADILEALKA